MCPPIYLSEIVFFVEYFQEKSSKLHFSAEFLILEKLKIVWKALHNGLPGRDGRDGAKGDKGMIGSMGSRGQKGDAGKNGADVDHRNWKQCAWRSEDSRDIGLIKVYALMFVIKT